MDQRVQDCINSTDQKPKFSRQKIEKCYRLSSNFAITLHFSYVFFPQLSNETTVDSFKRVILEKSAVDRIETTTGGPYITYKCHLRHRHSFPLVDEFG